MKYTSVSESYFGSCKVEFAGIGLKYLHSELFYRRFLCACLRMAAEIFVNWRMINIENTAIERLEMPFWLKLNLTKQEAAVYSNIGINRIDEMLKNPKCPFVLYVGNKKLVKRKEFEQYIAKSLEI